MNIKNTLISAAAFLLGGATGAATTWLILRNRPQNPSKVLQQTKDFAQLGELKGAWIDYDTIEYDLLDNAHRLCWRRYSRRTR